ncbi:hypothetical protein VB779_14455 [Haloarculaceae archaeon H-GB11]|nr:hypothetical protein [Haloarculaceae archaeon H-GB11]
MDNRALSPVIGKLFEIGLVMLYLGLVWATLYGGVLPDYQETAGHEVGERTLAFAAQRIEAVVPPNATHVSVRTQVDLPSTIAGASYVLRPTGGGLALDHPNDEVDDTVRLSLPSSVDSVRGRWQSGSNTVVSVTDGADGLVVTLAEGSS